LEEANQEASSTPKHAMPSQPYPWRTIVQRGNRIWSFLDFSLFRPLNYESRATSQHFP
jgi:hypothetical protein